MRPFLPGPYAYWLALALGIVNLALILVLMSRITTQRDHWHCTAETIERQHITLEAAWAACMRGAK